MIVEMRTYSLRPGTLQAALDRIARGLPERTTLSPLGAMWYTDVGRLHQLIHLWPFADLADRASVRARFSGLKNWPADTAEFTEESSNRILVPAAFSPALKPAKLGQVYEICTDTFRPHGLKKIVALWEPLIEARMKLSPMVGAWSSELGPMNQWVHIWAYEDFGHRMEVRARAAKQGWPPADYGGLLVRQENVICFPADFSPIA